MEKVPPQQSPPPQGQPAYGAPPGYQQEYNQQQEMNAQQQHGQQSYPMHPMPAATPDPHQHAQSPPPGQPQYQQGQPQQQYQQPQQHQQHQQHQQPQQGQQGQQYPQQQPQYAPQQQPQYMAPAPMPYQSLQSVSMPVWCDRCNKVVQSVTTHEAGNFTHGVAVLLCCFTWCCCWIPYVANSLQDVVHKCPSCPTTFATFHRSGRTEIHVPPPQRGPLAVGAAPVQYSA